MSSSESPRLPDLERLRSFDTPTVCNAIELFEFRSPAEGYMDRRIASCFPELPPMVGYAATATFRSSVPASPEQVAAGFSFQQLESFSELPGPAIVVIEDLDDPPAGATFGDGMCLTYHTFGAVGLVTSGAARDIDNVRALKFPCFSNGVMSGHGHCHFEAVSVPVKVGGMTIHQGDLLHGDCNGIVTIPMEIAAEIPYACEKYLEYESIVLDRLRQGHSDLSGHKTALIEMQRLLAELKIELKRRVGL
ncbi:4-hydroxy-4-methyl-2-oxoglutarate aldolase [Polystyrenella longa]|uniref:Putative 4-hydroxy-4-methyl-2-oxoglutarate aldolase n=1 Tax=Polystyrenella longa TaxID=2528007 RepID=A0A518CSX3_9PLAN|nr:RraA family protein [Polystyrenella longa]QDU82331.1 4-hydroxy-4-methyl-2-oxoglutarate aldolase [Polystyrenella longa]